MKTDYKNQRALCSATVFLFLLPALPLWANVHKSDAWAHSQFAIAEHKRALLEARPAQQQLRHEYQDVVNSYRRVYYNRPTSSKADASVLAVADVMAEMGRRFQDASLLRSAIAQYQFLRREYPGSKYRVEALFKVGQIYGNDLNDKANARKTFEDFVGRYPANHLAADARAALADPADQLRAGPGENISGKDSAEKDAARKDAETSADLVSSSGAPAQTSSKDESDADTPARVTGISFRSNSDYTRVQIDLDRDIDFTSQRIDSPDRIFFDLDARLPKKLIGKDFDVDDDLLSKIRIAQFKPGRARIVLEVGEHSDFYASVEPNPPRMIIDLKDSRTKAQAGWNQGTTNRGARSKDDTQGAIVAAPGLPKKRIVEADDSDDDSTPTVKSAKSTALSSKTDGSQIRNKAVRRLDVREAQPTADGDRSLIRALGLKIGKIVIDPGHGGYDTGTIGPHGIAEKDVVLDVSRRLGKLLQSRLGAQVVYTRKDDTFVPLETRTAIANQEKADLFVSVHANSSHDPSARGVETYYLNFSSSPDALEVAARENAVSETSIHELQDLVKQIALKEKIEESREFASDVQQELHSGLAAKNSGLRNRGVKKAPFIVLIGANMPSILAEISFVSNPGDERRLETAEYRQRIAESLYRGISKYVSGLSGVKVASKIEKTSER